MGLNIKNQEVERLAADVATLARETKTEAIRRALLERKIRLQASGTEGGPKRSLRDFMEREIWPLVPECELGRAMSREEREQILGYGPEGF